MSALHEVVGEVVEMVVEDVKAELARLGIFFGDVEELDTYGVRFCTIVFRDVNVNLENRELQKALSEACESWERLFKMLALEKVVSGGELNVYNYVDVEEISWSKRHGPYVRLDVSMEVDGLLRKYGLANINVREMEECLEGILDYEARRILRKLNGALQEALSEGLRNCHARGETVSLCK